jgi:hypothetical protein
MAGSRFAAGYRASSGRLEPPEALPKQAKSHPTPMSTFALTDVTSVLVDHLFCGLRRQQSV